MTTLNGLPAHILLIHAIVVLMPLSALLLVLSVVWTGVRRKLALTNVILALVSLILVPITTDAGEWLQRRVSSTAALRDHTELGDTALAVAIPLAVLAIVVWWRGREMDALANSAAGAEMSAQNADGRTTVKPRRAFMLPASSAVTVAVLVLSVLASGAAVYDIYRIGDSGAKASWQGKFSATEISGPGAN